MKESVPKKIAWVDSLRGFTILAVVLGHIASPLTPIIFSWHIPMFFFLSGFFIKPDRPVFPAVKKDFRKLILPFIIFSLIALLLELVKRRLLPNYPFAYANISFTEELKGIFFWMDYSHLHHYGFVLWFLPALFWSKLIVHSLLKWLKNLYIIPIVLLIVFYLFANSRTILPFCLDKAFLSSIWVFLGYFYFNFLNHKINSKIKIASMFLLLIGLWLIPTPIVNISLKMISPVAIGFLYSLMAIITITFLFGAFQKIGNMGFLRNWGENTLFVLVIHPYINNASYIIVGKYFNSNWFLELIISVILISLLLIPFNYGKKRIRNPNFADYF